MHELEAVRVAQAFEDARERNDLAVDGEAAGLAMAGEHQHRRLRQEQELPTPMQERGLVVIETVPHLRARQPREQLLQHVTERELAVVERALPMRLGHHQPDQGRARHDALAAERARRLVRLQPFSAERVAGGIEIEDGPAGEIPGVELEREAGAVEFTLDARRRVVLRQAEDAPRILLHEPQAAELGVPQAVAITPALPWYRARRVLGEILAGEAPVPPELEAAGAALLRLRIAESEFIRRRGAFDRVLGDLAAIGTAHTAAVLGEDHGPERG